ncbi:MAG: nucleotidyltransferase family protein [Roseiflexaceae bacterium]
MASYRSPDLLRYSQAVAGWLAGPAPGALAAQVAGWDDAAWDDARWAIQVHGIGPLLHHALAARPDAAALQPRLRGYLADQHHLSGERVALLLGELAELLRACRAAGVAVLPLKGALLATQYYPSPGLRPMNDLDLLARPEDEPRLLAVLERLGYRLVARSWKHMMLARPEGRGPVVSWEGEHPANPRSLDLHLRLGEQFWGLRYDLTTSAWESAQPGTLLEVETLLMSPAALLHHLAVHASSDTIARRLRRLHLHDIALVARALDDAGWRQILAWVCTQGEARLIYPALAFTSRYYPVIPESILRELRARLPPALLRHLDASELDRFSFCNSAPTTVAEKLCWFRPGREQLVALRHMALPDAGEIAIWYPSLARPALLPLAYARYGIEMLGWAVRRALGRPRRKLARGREEQRPMTERDDEDQTRTAEGIGS